jgi:hypothetical protein
MAVDGKAAIEADKQGMFLRTWRVAVILESPPAPATDEPSVRKGNSEGDEAINHDYAMLAVEYNLPLWNFWAATSGLPERGLYTRTEVRYQGDVYLTKAARLIHRYSALQALNAVWRAVSAVP